MTLKVNPKSRPRVDIVQFATDRTLLNLNLSAAQRTLLKSFYGEPLAGEEQDIFRECVQRDYEARPYSEMTCIAGARSGKDSRIATVIGLYEAFMRDHSYLAAGERGFVVIIAQDARAGSVLMHYIKAAIDNSAFLRSQVVETRKQEIELQNNIVIAIYPCSYRSPRGITIICGLADECAFWRDENSANPDIEIVRSLRRGMANVPNAKLVKISTPYAKSGVLYDDFCRRHDLKDVVVWTSATWLMNPSIPQAFFDREREKDPVAFAREYGAEFSEDIATLIPAEVIAAAVRDYRELPPRDNIDYFGAVDASAGGPDAFTAAVSHRDGERIVLDWVQGWRSSKPEDVVSEIAGRLKPFRILSITGDRFSGAWVRDAFQRNGLSYTTADKNKSEFYLEALAPLNQGRVDLPNEPTLIKELRGLERRTGRNSRDVVDHMPGQHDDYANSAAIAIVLAHQPGGWLYHVDELIKDRQEKEAAEEAEHRSGPLVEQKPTKKAESCPSCGNENLTCYAGFSGCGQCGWEKPIDEPVQTAPDEKTAEVLAAELAQAQKDSVFWFLKGII